MTGHFLNWGWQRSLAPGISGNNFKSTTFKLTIQKSGLGTGCEIALRRMPQNLANESTFVQVMAWCHQATSQYLSQCWPRFRSRYGITRPQWVNVSIRNYKVKGFTIMQVLEPGSVWRCHVASIGIPITKIWWSQDCLILIMKSPHQEFSYWNRALVLWNLFFPIRLLLPLFDPFHLKQIV